MLVQSDQRFPDTPSAWVPLGKGLFALVDPGWYDYLLQFNWYAKKSAGRYYACRKVTKKGKVSFVRMHRFIAATPPDQLCHHINGNTLDNRSANLRNMSNYEHSKLYSYR